MKNIVFNLIVFLFVIALAEAVRGKCDFPRATLKQICQLCKNVAKQETHMQNKSIRTKVACVGLINHNCCVGLYISHKGLYMNADISRIFAFPDKRGFRSISQIGFM